jgi:predicted SAM-dependent methyltransferase
MDLHTTISELCQSVFQYFCIRTAQNIIIGAGGIEYPGWVSTTKEQLDITKRDHFLRYWKENSRTAFLAEHVWEHLEPLDAARANSLCFAFLRPNGRLRIAVPDGLHPDPAYIDSVRPGGTGEGAEDHKVLYTYQTLGKQLNHVGFQVDLLEYWDEHGLFHIKEWLSKDGHIRRSRNHDPRNREGGLVYTSLIIDAIKPKEQT